MVGRCLAALVALAFGVGCGTSCPTEGCDALHGRASGDYTGIGGVVASQSDVVENGCAECGFASATIDIFDLSAPVQSEEEATAIVRDTLPRSTIEAAERYAEPLDPGEYLVCAHTSCVAVSVTAGAVTTVNVKLRYGPASFFLADAGTGGLAEDFGFDVSAAMQ